MVTGTHANAGDCDEGKVVSFDGRHLRSVVRQLCVSWRSVTETSLKYASRSRSTVLKYSRNSIIESS